MPPIFFGRLIIKSGITLSHYTIHRNNFCATHRNITLTCCISYGYGDIKLFEIEYPDDKSALSATVFLTVGSSYFVSAKGYWAYTGAGSVDRGNNYDAKKTPP